MNDGNGMSFRSQYSTQFMTQFLGMDSSEYRLMSELATVSTEVSLQMFPLSFFRKICSLSDKSRLSERLKRSYKEEFRFVIPERQLKYSSM